MFQTDQLIGNCISYCRNIDDVDKTMDEINEQTENMKQIQEALATPIGAAADFDEVRGIFISPNCNMYVNLFLILLKPIGGIVVVAG